MKLIRNLQCQCCKKSFTPDYRSVKRQKYCDEPECRKASKAASQKRWIKKNPTYFTGSDNVERVREWRLANPGRRRRKSSCDVLQDICGQIADTKQGVIPLLPAELSALPPVLQDFCVSQDPVIIGLISQLTGFVLQDQIATVIKRMEQLGQDVICSTTGGRYAPQVPNLSRPHPQHSGAVQLGGSPSGS